MELGATTWTDLDDLETPPVVVVPVGSCEQHGPHLPLHTDTLIASALAHRLAEVRPSTLVAPPLAITASGEHQGFPGTLSIGTAATTEMIVELCRSADWAAGVVLVNGHGGNRAAVDAAVDVLVSEARRVLAWWPSVPGGDAHAGRTETSLLLAIAPSELHLERAVAGATPTFAELVHDGVRTHSPSGVLGDPTGATADEGRALLGDLVEQLVSAVDRWTQRPHP